MKKTIKLIGLTLCAVTAVAFVGCGGDSNTTDPTPTPTQAALKTGLDMTHLSNYVVKYTVEEAATDTTTGETVVKKTDNVEAGYSGMYFASNDGGEFYANSSASCFSVESVSDPRGWFNAHNNYLADNVKDKVTNEGNEKIAGYDTIHYHYKNGLFDVDFYVNEELNIVLKYVDNHDNKSLTVTELEFGVVNSKEGYGFSDFQDRVPTPAPATPEAEVAE